MPRSAVTMASIPGAPTPSSLVTTISCGAAAGDALVEPAAGPEVGALDALSLSDPPPLQAASDSAAAMPGTAKDFAQRTVVLLRRAASSPRQCPLQRAAAAP